MMKTDFTCHVILYLQKQGKGDEKIVYKITLAHRLKFLRGFLRNIYFCLTKQFPFGLLLCDVDLGNIPEGTIFNHPIGIVIRNNVRIGSDCRIEQGVTIGQRRNEPEGAIIGSNVKICAHAIVLGNIRIGNNATIGAGSIVLNDVPENTTVIGIWK